tara:strand:+ start:193 stop:321 length:129 start_codon:yes stop_codon:yes gene_type:complete
MVSECSFPAIARTTEQLQIIDPISTANHYGQFVVNVKIGQLK